MRELSVMNLSFFPDAVFDARILSFRQAEKKKNILQII